MNKIFKVIWSKSKQCYIVVSEIAKNKTGKKKIVVASILAILAMAGTVNSVEAAIPEGTTSDPLGIAMGALSKSGSNQSIAIGYLSEAKGTNAASGGGNPGTAVGAGAKSIGAGTSAYGLSAYATADYATAIGKSANAAAINSIAIGKGTSITTPTTGTTVGGQDSIAMGTGASAKQHSSVTIGVGSTSDGVRNITIGPKASASGVDSIAIGNGGVGGDKNNTGFGGNGNTYTINVNDISTNVYYGVKSVDDGSIAFGNRANAAKGGLAIGTVSIADGGIAVGQSVLSKNGVAIGSAVSATAANAVALGSRAEASSVGAVAIGGYSVTDKTKAQGNNALAIGASAVTNGNETIAIGKSANASNSNAVAVGKNANASIANSVAIGSDSTTDTNATRQANTTINGITYNFAGATSDAGMQVSVGAAGKERQIKNVAAGEVSATSTDAINGSQLFAVASQIKPQLKYVSIKSDTELDNANNDGATADKAIAIGPIAKASSKSAVAIGNTSTASSENAIAIGNNSNSSGVDSVAIGPSSVSNNVGSVAVGKDAKANGAFTVALGGGNWQSKGAQANGVGTIALGTYTRTKESTNYQTAVGFESKTDAESATAIGYKAVASGKDSVALGTGASTTGQDALTFGHNSQANGNSSLAMGLGAQANSNNAIALGYQTNSNSTNSTNGVFIGSVAGKETNGVGNIGIGSNTGNKIIGDNNVSIGTGAGSVTATNVYASESIMLGTQARAINSTAANPVTNVIAIGKGSSGGSNSTIAIGQNASSTNQNSIAIGTNASAPAYNGVAIGSFSVANTEGGTVEGYNANASRTDKYAGLAGAVLKGNLGAVSIGNGGTMTRQIKNLAAGTADTDAVNVAQLKSVNLAFKGNTGVGGDVNLATNPLTIKGNDSYITTNASGNTITISANQKDIHVISGTANADTGVANAKNVATAINDAISQNKYKWYLTADNDTAGSRATIDKEGTVKFSGDPNITVARSGNTITSSLNKIITVDTVKASKSVIAGSGNDQITLDGTSGTVKGKTFSGQSFAAGNNVLSNTTLQIGSATNGDNNVTISRDGFSSKAGTKTVKFGATGIDAGGQVITNVSSGGNVGTNAANITDVKNYVGKVALNIQSNSKTGTINLEQGALGVTGANGIRTDLSGTGNSNLVIGLDKNTINATTNGIGLSSDSGTMLRKFLKDGHADFKISGDGGLVTTSGTTTGVQVSVDKSKVKDLAVEAVTVSKANTVDNPITVTPTTGSNSKEYAIGIDTSKLAAKTEVTYRANNAADANAKKVSLSKGFNFVDGGSTVATVDNDGKVSFDLNTATKNQINTNTTDIAANTTALARNISLGADTGTASRQSLSTADVAFNVKGSTGDFVSTNMNGNTVEISTTRATINSDANTGAASVTGNDGIATAKNVADAINKAADAAKAGSAWNVSTNGDTSTKVSGGDTVDFTGDNNITVDRNNKTISTSLNKNLTDMNSISLGNARGETIFLNGRDGSIKAGKAEFKDNVGAGSTITSDQLSFTNGATGANEATTTIALDTVAIQSGPNSSALTSKYLMFSDEDGNNAEGSAKGMSFQNAAGKLVQFTVDEITAGGNKIQEVAEGTADTDAVNVKQLKDTIGGQSLTYRANTSADTDAKSVKLSKGLDFVNGTSTVASVDEDGKVSFDLNTATKTQINTNTTDIATNKDNISTNTADIATNKGKIATNTTNIATNTANIAHTIALADDAGASTTAKSLKDGNVSFNIKGDNKYISTAASGNDVTLTVNEQAIKDAAKSASSFKVKANTHAEEEVKGGDTITFNNGDNIEISQTGKTFTIGTAKNITVDSVTAGNTVINTSGLTNGTTAITGTGITTDKVTVGGISIDKTAGINAGGKVISNVASGNVNNNATDNSNAANIGDVKQAVANLSQNLNITDGTNNGTVDLKNQKLNVAGANGVTATVNNQKITVGLDANTVNATTKGIGLTADTGSTGNKYLKDGDVSFAVTGDGNLVSTSATAAGVKVAVDAAKVKDLAVSAVTVSKDAQADNPITVTPTAGTNSKEYAIGIDTTKLAAKTDLTYRANSAADANAKKVSLSKGLNFVDGGSTVATVDNDGKVSFDLNTATKNQITTNTTDIAANKGKIATNTTNIAANTTALARNISLGADTGTASSQSLSTADVAFNVKGATGDFVSTNMNGNTVEISTKRATINSNATTGEASVTGNDGLATAQNVADAINKAADAAKAGAAWNITTNSSTTDKTAVKGGDTVDLVNGDNIEITQDGTDKKKITVATKKDITVDSVTANNKVTVGSGANKITLDGTDGSVTGKAFTGTTFTGTSFTGTSFTAGNTVINTNGLTNGTTAITGTGVTTDNVTVGGISIDKTAGINAGNKVISNVASGGTTLTNAANIGDVQNAVANLSQNLNITDGTHDGTVDLKNQKLNVAGANGVTATVNNQTITVGLDADTVNATTKGIGLTADTGSTGNKYLKDGDVSFAVTGDGSLVSTSATAAGVKVAVNSATITAGADGTITGPTTDGVATAKNVADAINAAKKASKTEITANTGEAANATTGNVTLTSTTAADGHTIYDVKLNDKVTLGTGANAVIIDGTTGAITGKTATIGGVTVNGTANTIGGLSNTTWNGTATTGRAATEDQLKAVADAAGSQTWEITADKKAGTSGAQTGTKENAKVGKDDKVSLIAGENLTVDQAGKNFTYSLNKDLVKMNSATFEATGGKTTVIKGDSIVQTDGTNVNTSNATSNTITDGTNTSTITAGKSQIGTVGIDGVVSKITTGGANAVVVNGADGTVKTGNVTVTGGTTNDITGLSNTTLSATDFATKGRAATEEQLKAATGATTLKFTGDVATNTGSVNLKDDTFGIKGDGKYISTDVNGKNVNLTVSEAEVKKSAVAAVTVSTDTTDANNPLTVTPTTSADGTTKDYKVTIDGTKIANKTNLSYKANDGTAKQVSLADGLNFKNGTLTTASIDDNGVVKYDVNTASITAGADGTITGPTTDGVATAQNVADAINAAKKASKTEVTANTGEAANATTGNVTLTSTTAADGHTIYDVKLNDKVTLGTGANAVTVDGTAAKVTAGVTTVDGATGTITTGGTNSIKVDGATGTVTGLTNKDWTPGVTKAVTGRVATEDQLQKVADAASSQTWNITADKAGTTGAQTGTKKNATVGKDETVELVAGDNLTINQDERKFTYSLNKNLAGLTSVSIGTGTTETIKLDGATGKITAKNAAIGGVTVDGDNKHVTGLSNTTWNGTATTGRAATEDQLKAVAETAKTTTDAVNLKFTGDTNTSPGVVNLKDDTLGIVGDGKYVSTDANGKKLTVKVSEAEVKKSAVAAVTVSTDTTDANNPLTVTPTTSADGTTKDYKVTIDGTKIANKTNLSYKANDGTPKQVSLADGLNFKNGTLTTASIDDAGVVKYDVNTAAITAGADGTITGPTTDGVATAQNVADAINAAKKASKTEITANTGEAANATTGNVTLTSTTAADGHTIYDVKLNDKVTLGSGANAVTIDGTAGKATIGSSVINGVNNTFTTGGAKAVTLDGATGTITGTTANIGGVTVNGTANTIGGLSNTTWNGTATTGRAATEDQLKAVADAAGSQTWEITADKDAATSGAQTGTKKNAKVGKDDKVQLIAGENLTVNQNERDFTYSLNKDLVKMNSATFEATGGKTTVIKGDSIVQTDGANVNTSNATSNTITDGTNTSTITAGKAQIGTVGIDGVVSKISTGGTNAVVVNGADGTIKTGNVTVTGGTTNDITGLSNTTVTAADFATKGRAATEEQLKAATGATTLKFTGDVATNTGSVNLKDDTFGIKGDGKYISTDVNGKNVNLTISEAEVKKSAVAAVTVSTDTTDANNPLTVTPTTSADGTTKDYKVTIDGTKIANKTNLSYKANDGTAKQVSLADGLNFKNGTLTTASIDDNGVVKYDVNTASITAGADGTITGPTTDGVATAQNVADAINAAKKAAKTEITANAGEAANSTKGNVTLTSTTAADGHTIYDVKLNDKVTLGSGANAVTIDGTAGKATIGSSIVDGVNSTFTTGGANAVKLDGAAGTIKTGTVTVTGGTTNDITGLSNTTVTSADFATKGRAATEEQLKAVGEQTWQITADKDATTSGAQTGTKKDAKVGKNDKVQLIAGENLTVNQNERDFTYSLNKDLVKMNSATFEATGGRTTVIKGDSIVQTDGTKVNTSTAGGSTVADGTKSTETTADGQVIKDGAKSNKSTVDSNVIDDGNGNVNTSNATSNTITDGTNTSTVTAGKAQIGTVGIDGVASKITTGGANAVVINGADGTVKTGTVTVIGGTTNDITGLSNTTVTAADFATKGRAATEEQLKAVGEQTWQITADKDATTSGVQTGTKKDAKVGKDDKVQLIAGENLTVNQNERDFTYSLNKDLVKMNSATFEATGGKTTVIKGDSIVQTDGTKVNTSTAAGNTVVDGAKSTATTADGTTVTTANGNTNYAADGVRINTTGKTPVSLTDAGLDNGNNVIKNVASGHVNNDATDNTNAANIADVKKATTTVTANAGEAANATTGNVTLTSTTAADGHTIYDVKLNDKVTLGSGANAVTIDGTAGKATFGSSVVDGVNNTFTTGGANAVKLDGAAGTIKTGTVTVTGGTTNDITGLSNTTVTAADFATKGRAATEEQLKAVGEQTWQITADKDATTSGAQTGTKKDAKVGKNDKVQLIAGENMTVNQNERDFTFTLNKDLVKMNSATFEATGGKTTVIKGDSIVQTDGTKVNTSTAVGNTVADGTKSTETTADGQVIKDGTKTNTSTVDENTLVDGAKSNKATVDSNVVDDGNGNVNTSNATSNTITDGTNRSTITAGKATIGSSVIDGVNNTFTTGGANAVKLDGAAGTIKTGTVTVTGGTTNDITGLSNTTVTAADFATKGRAATEEQLKAVGEQTWQITADKDVTTSGAQTGTKKDAKVGKDDKVQLIAGENMTVNQNERDFTFILNKDLVKMNSATFEATGGKITVIKGDSIVQTDGTKTNTATASGNTVANGTKSTETTADGQVIKDGAKTNTSTVDENTIVDGTKSNKSTVDGNTITDGTNTTATTSSSVTVKDNAGNSTVITKDNITTGVGGNKITLDGTAGKATIGSSVVDGVNNTFTTGGANAVKLDGAAGTVKTGTVTVTGGTTNDITGLSNTTVTAADFATKGRAATEEQLKAVGEQTWQITADKDATTSGTQTGTKKDAKVGKDDKVQLIAGENMTVNQNERDFTFTLNKDLVKMNSATFLGTGTNKTVITGDSITQTAGTQTNTSTAGGNTVADGTKSTETTAAGQVIKNGAKSNKSTVDNNVIDDGTGNVNTSNATSNTITDGTNTTATTSSSVTVKDNAGNSTVITKDNITTGVGGNKITLDGTAGKATIGASVVDGVNNTFTTGGTNAVKLDGAAGTIKTGTVTVTGGTTNDITGLSNTTVNAADFATKGRAATEEQLKAVGEQTWQITADKDTATSGAQTGTKKNAKVGKDNKVQLIAGENMTINQNERDFTFTLNKDLVKMNSATFLGTGSNTTVITGNSITQTAGTQTNTSTAGGNTITDGTKSTETTAAGQVIKDGAKTNKSTVDSNVIDDGNGNKNISNATSNTITDGTNTSTITAGKANIGNIAVDGVNNKITVGNGANPVTLDGANGHLDGLTNTTWVPGVTKATTGRAATEDQLQQVSDAVGAGWKVNTGTVAASSGVSNGAASTKVSSGEEVKLQAGDNLVIDQNGKTVSYSLNKDLTKMNSATFEATGGKTTVIKGDSIVQTDGSKTNTSNAAGNTVVDGNKSTATTAAGTTITDGAKTNTSTADKNVINDGSGNTNTATATSNTLKNAAGDETKVDANGATVKDAAGNNATFTKDGITITNTSKDTVSLTSNGLDNGKNKIINVADGTNPTDAVNVRQLDAKTKAATTELTANDGQPANSTNGNIMIAKSIDTKDGHTIYDTKLNDKITLGAADPTKAITVDGIAGTIKAGRDGNAVAINGTNGTVKAGDGTNAVAIDGVNGTIAVADKITLNGKDGKAGIGTVGIDGKDGIITTGGTNSVKVDGTTGTVTGLTNKTWTPGSIVSGRAATEDQLKDAVADSGWKVAVGKDGSGQSNVVGTSPEKIKAEETVTFKAGNNMMVTQTGKSISYAVNPELTNMTSATFTDTTTGNTTVMNSNGITITPSGANPTNPHAGPVSLTKDGLNNGNNQIKGVAPGTDPTDAVNVSQLNASNANTSQAINQVAGEVQHVGAHAAAMAALKPIQYDPLEPTQIMAGVGNYRGETAAALGLAHYTNENTMFNVGVSVGGNHNMVNAGVTHKFGYSPEKKNIPDRYKAGPISSVYVMQDEVSSLKKENAEQKYVIADQAARLTTLEAENEQQRRELAETKKGLDDLKAAVDKLLASKG